MKHRTEQRLTLYTLKLITSSLLGATILVMVLIGAVEAMRNDPFQEGCLTTSAFETGFEDGLNCWGNQEEAITAVNQSAEQAHSGRYAMELTVAISSTAAYTYGEVFVKLDEAQDLSGQTLTTWVHTPIEARGNFSSPNGIHLFVEDISGHRLYGTWRNMALGGWFPILLKIQETAPACGSVGRNFNPKAIKKIGINIGAGRDAGVTAAYDGPIFIDDISLGTPALPESDHFYDFEGEEAEKHFPKWGTDSGFSAEAWTEVEVENGMLVANALFNHKDDKGRKGFVNILYSPYLNLTHKDHHIISLDVRFEPSATNPHGDAGCPFALKIGVEERGRQKWFWSDDLNVGASEWTRLSVDFDNLAEFASDADSHPQDTPNWSDIRRVGIQLFANQSYTGKVLFDNIVIGGKERNVDPPPLSGFVQAEGTQFMLNGEPIRFVNFNIEYLFLLSEEELAQILDAVALMPSPHVIRTWGFSDGCDGNLEPCEIYSPYFQPTAGQWNKTAFENFDRLVAMAGQRDIRLIVSLANNWHEYGGAGQYVEWLQEMEPTQVDIPSDLISGTEAYSQTLHAHFFETKYTRELYKDYVTAFIDRTNHVTGIPYKDDPTIFSWELINEPRNKDDVTGRVIHNWIVEMSEHVESLAPHQMISVGMEGWYIKPIAEARESASWQDFPRNYWHYGVNWRQDCDVNADWGSNGSDFISNHATEATTVYWNQHAGDEKGRFCPGPLMAEERAGVPHIDFANLHLYVADSPNVENQEANLESAPYLDWGFTECLADRYHADYFQAGEWLWQHVQDAHTVIGKPLLVGEFGLRLSGKTSCQSPPYIPPLTEVKRRKLYQHYLQTMCQMGVNGALIWNLSYGEHGEESLIIHPDKPIFDTLVAEAQTWTTETGACPQFDQFKPEISRVQPVQGQSIFSTTIDIYGTDFAIGATAHLNQFELTRTHWISTTLIRATVLPYLSEGTYDLTVANPNDEKAVHTSAYTVVPANDKIIYVSSSTNGRVANLSFHDEDVLAYDPKNDEWTMVFDGSDVGLGGRGVDVNAFHRMTDGSMLLSFNRPTALEDIGLVDDSDIVRFVPQSLGGKTQGHFEWYLDGSDVDLTERGEDIDAIGFTKEGHLVISTLGSHRVSIISGKDEDLLLFNPSNLGQDTSGVWKAYFDGSDVVLTKDNEDVWGIWLDPMNDDIYLTTRSHFIAKSLNGNGSDIFICTSTGSTSQNTHCTFNRFWRGANFGFGSERIDALMVGDLIKPVVVSADNDSQSDPEDEIDDDVEGSTEQPAYRLFLPVIR